MDLKIPKTRSPVEVVFTNSAELSCYIFLAGGIESRVGLQKPSEVFNGEETFIPTLAVDDNKVKFLNRHGILYVRVENSAEGLEKKEDEIYWKNERVVFTLKSGEELGGAVFFNQPPERQRTLDFLNLSGKFISVLTPTGTYLVNREHVLLIEFAETDAGEAARPWEVAGIDCSEPPCGEGV